MAAASCSARPCERKPKRQVKYDYAICALGFVQSFAIPQLLVDKDENGSVDIVFIKIVDDILANGRDEALKTFVSSLNQRINLGDSAHGPGRLHFFGLKIIQNEDFSCSIYGDENLKEIEPYPLSRVRCGKAEEEMNEIERTAFMSVNANIGWLRTTVSLFCAFHARYLQQKLPDARVSAIMSQGPSLPLLNRYGTLSAHVSPPRECRDNVTLVAFADASHSETGSQLCYIPITRGYGFHLLTWGSQKSRRPVKWTVAAEILDAGEGTDEVASLRNVLSLLFNTSVKLAILVDLRELFR